MTLNTTIYVHGPVDHREVFEKVNEILGIPETREMVEGSGKWSRAGLYEISNSPDQGFSAWVTSYSDPLGAEITNQCTSGVCDPQGCDDHDATIPSHHVEVNIDTAYGYRGEQPGCQPQNRGAVQVTQRGRQTIGRHRAKACRCSKAAA